MLEDYATCQACDNYVNAGVLRRGRCPDCQQSYDVDWAKYHNTFNQ